MIYESFVGFEKDFWVLCRTPLKQMRHQMGHLYTPHRRLPSGSQWGRSQVAISFRSFALNYALLCSVTAVANPPKPPLESQTGSNVVVPTRQYDMDSTESHPAPQPPPAAPGAPPPYPPPKYGFCTRGPQTDKDIWTNGQPGNDKCLLVCLCLSLWLRSEGSY